MAARHVWAMIAVVLLPLVLAPARAVDERVVAILPPSDFLILAIKPEGDQKEYKLIPVGEASIDPAAYGKVVKTLPRGFMGFGLATRDHDERAELQQCRTACAANAKCGNFTYVRPGKDRPLGVCHLRRAIDNPNLVSMTPVVETSDPKNALPNRDGRRFVLIDSTRNGRALYPAEQAPPAPVTFKFKEPVANAKADVRVAAGERVWVNIEALDKRGRVFKRNGMWVVPDGAAHQALMRTDSDRIASLRIAVKDSGAVIVDSIDFVRHAAVDETAPAEDAKVADDTNKPASAPEVVAEAAAPVQPADAPTAPAEVAEPPAEQSAPKAIAVEVPKIAENDTSITFPIAPPAAASPTRPDEALPERQPLAEEVPIVAAAGVVLALLVGGAALYRKNYRTRTRHRLTTMLVSDGFDRQEVSVTSDDADLSLRFSVRAPAAVGARDTIITITPDGAAA